MLVIRLARTGRHKYPVYRLVAADKRKAATGKFVSVLGHYNPHTKELVVDKDQVVKYLSNGAQPSNTVAKLLQKEKIQMPDWVGVTTRNRPPKKEPAAEPKAEAVTAPEEEATAEVSEEPKAEAPQQDSDEQVAAVPTESVAETATEQEQAVEANASDVSDVETAETA